MSFEVLTLKDAKVSADLTSIGSLFHSVGAEKPKLLSPYIRERIVKVLRVLFNIGKIVVTIEK